MPTGEVNKAKTHCPHGHEYTEENTYFDGLARRCRTCARKRTNEWRRIHRALARESAKC